MWSIFLLGGLFRSGKAWAAPRLSLTRNQCVSKGGVDFAPEPPLLLEDSGWCRIIGVVS